MDFITSDLHFYHNNILKFSHKTRPFKDVDHMVEMLIQEWNSLAGVNDNVYHLGDFSFGKYHKTLEVLNRLNGRIHFIKGNHDSREVFKKLIKETTANVVWFKDYHEMKHNNTLITMTHYPFEIWRDSHKGSVHLHGHTHGSMPSVGRRVDVGYDSYGKIISLDKAVEDTLKLKIQAPDIHKQKGNSYDY